MTTKTDIIKLATNYIKEYADNQEELSAEKTAEVIYDLMLRGTLELKLDHNPTLASFVEDKIREIETADFNCLDTIADRRED